MGPDPLQPLEFFAQPWEGEGEWIPARWLRRFAHPRRLRFRSWTTPISGTTWLVHDETVWADGSVDGRDGTAVVLAERRLRLTYDDMPGGTEVTLRGDGFSFAPYRMAVRVPLLPVMLLVLCRDECVLGDDGVLEDTVDVSFMGLPLGRQVTRLRRTA